MPNRLIYLKQPNSSIKSDRNDDRLKLSYDYLILAIGSIHNDFGTLGAKDFCLSFDTIKECNAFHNNLIISLFDLIQTNKKELNIAIIGGGSTGVELAFEVKNTIVELLKHKSIAANNLCINLSIVEQGATILSNLADKIKEKTIRLLNSSGIKIYSAEKVTSINQEFIFTESGKQIKADIKLWTAGIKAPDLLTSFGLKTNEKNQLLLKNTLQILEDEHIFAIGDCANFAHKEQLLPPTAQTAHQQAKFLANSLSNWIKNNVPLKKFHFKNQGVIISTSKTNAVGEVATNTVGKIALNKKLAYLSYRFLYRRYQASLYGYPRVIILIIIDFLSRRVKPNVKLH